MAINNIRLRPNVYQAVYTPPKYTTPQMPTKVMTKTKKKRNKNSSGSTKSESWVFSKN